MKPGVIIGWIIWAGLMTLLSVSQAFAASSPPATEKPGAIQKNGTPVTQTPFGQPSLGYEFMLPQGWQASHDSGQGITDINPAFLTELGRYFSPAYGDVRGFISIQAIRLSHEIFAEDWFRSIALNNSFTIKAQKVISTQEIETLYTSFEKDYAYAIRARVIISGNILFFVRIAVPVNAYEEASDTLKQALNSFKLSQPGGVAIETERRFAVMDALSLYHPASWQIKNPNFRDMGYLSVDLIRLNENAIIFGEIKITAINKNTGLTVADEIQRFLKRLQDRNLSIQALHEKTPLNVPPPFKGSAIEVYKMNVPTTMLNQELWFTYFETDTHFYLYAMLTPERDVSFDEWAKNRAAFVKMASRFYVSH